MKYALKYIQSAHKIGALKTNRGYEQWITNNTCQRVVSKSSIAEEAYTYSNINDPFRFRAELDALNNIYNEWGYVNYWYSVDEVEQ